MMRFEDRFAKLNTAQKLAVTTIDGPVLVVAGPGTGKTQLLSMRVANILRETDALPSNILCLTFTESGAQNMRDRLAQFIGSDAYDIPINTYHGFGSDIIRRFPEYFSELRLERSIDALGKHQILSAIVDQLPYQDPLKQLRWHIRDLVSTISEVKQGLLNPGSLRALASANIKAITGCSPDISDALRPAEKRMPRKLDAALPLFESVLAALRKASQSISEQPRYKRLPELAADALQNALFAAADAGSTKALTAWKDVWLMKNDHNQYVLKGEYEASRMLSLANVLEAYDATMQAQGLYDFDDMILKVIEALEQHPEMKYSLQEQYQYLLLDEFQDTNAAQFKIVSLLTDNPASEGRPNVLAVGDDDQAIYAFQGAEYSNMLNFHDQYRDVTVINLSENYRASEPLLATARNIAHQITDSLSGRLPSLHKRLVPSGTVTAETQLDITEYSSEVAERSGVAARIAGLIAAGAAPSEIAVLAPKHKYLEALVPYLQDHGMSVSYERREDILQAPAIRQLIVMSRLVQALANRDDRTADSLWPEVLSYPFWGHRVQDIWQVSWEANDMRTPWSQLLLQSKTFSDCALLFLALAGQFASQPLESMLDRLIGTEGVETGDPENPAVRSPYRDYYTGTTDDAEQIYRIVTELAVLRARLREHQEQRGDQLTMGDFLSFVSQCEAANQQLLNTSPYNQAADAVKLMTVYKAKGLEFEHVFIVEALDNVWGTSANDASNRLSLPANLAPIRYAGTSEDERLRIFFVAATRAKHGLHFTSHRATYGGKQTTRLKFLQAVADEDGAVESAVLPSPYNTVLQADLQAPALTALEHDWRQRHLTLEAPLQALLQERLQRYRLSPTDLTSFIDLEHGGPQAFLLEKLLEFPSAPAVDAAFGSAVHATLQWLQQRLNLSGALPALESVQRQFSDYLGAQSLYGEQLALQEARGYEALAGFLASSEATFRAGNKPEYGFWDQGIILDGGIRLNGKIDLLEIDEQHKKLTIVDYKTGSAASSPAKMHRYQLQLYGYKLLLQHSRYFKHYTIDSGRLVFVEPAMNGGKPVSTVITFDDTELARVEALVRAVWQRIQAVAMPATDAYGVSLTEIRKFEAALLDGTV